MASVALRSPWGNCARCLLCGRAFLGRNTPEHRVWEGLQQRFAAVLTSDGNLPYLVDVLDSRMATGCKCSLSVIALPTTAPVSAAGSGAEA
jgi:hypothetical protein